MTIVKNAHVYMYGTGIAEWLYITSSCECSKCCYISHHSIYEISYIGSCDNVYRLLEEKIWFIHEVHSIIQ